jgi:hypothetical protein
MWRILKVSFFVFLDVSGILLGIFLAGLGAAILLGWQPAGWMGWVFLVIGTCAFLLHLGHYFDLKYMRWLFGSRYFVQR